MVLLCPGGWHCPGGPCACLMQGHCHTPEGCFWWVHERDTHGASLQGGSGQPPLAHTLRLHDDGRPVTAQGEAGWPTLPKHAIAFCAVGASGSGFAPDCRAFLQFSTACFEWYVKSANNHCTSSPVQKHRWNHPHADACMCTFSASKK